MTFAERPANRPVWKSCQATKRRGIDAGTVLYLHDGAAVHPFMFTLPIGISRKHGQVRRNLEALAGSTAQDHRSSVVDRYDWWRR